MFKKAAALLLSAVLMAGASTAAFAESAPEYAVVTQEFGASAKVWDGKSELKAGTKYVLKSSATITGKVTLPKGSSLTLYKGAKLTVGTKGTLTVKGTLSAKAGSTITISGTLTAASGSKITAAGKVKLGKNAKVTLGGRFTVAKAGAVSGTPKTIKLGKKGTVDIKGKNTCKKLAALLEPVVDQAEIDRQEIEALLNDLVKKSASGDIYGTIKEVIPAAYIEKLEKAFQEKYSSSVEEAMNLLVTAVMSQMGVNASDMKDIADGTKITVTKLTDIMGKLTDSQKAVFDGTGDITKAYTVDFKGEYTGKAAELAEDADEAMTINAAYAGGKWYLFA